MAAADPPASARDVKSVDLWASTRGCGTSVAPVRQAKPVPGLLRDARFCAPAFDAGPMQRSRLASSPGFARRLQGVMAD